MTTTYDTGKHRWEHNEPIYQDGQAVRWLLGPCPKCGSVTSTYGGGYSCHNDCCPHSANNFTCNAGPKPDWWDTDIRVFLDGDAWCATGAGFERAGFGDSPAAAVADLSRSIGVHAVEPIRMKPMDEGASEMMCNKHKEKPARGYPDCAGGEVEVLQSQLAALTRERELIGGSYDVVSVNARIARLEERVVSLTLQNADVLARVEELTAGLLSASVDAPDMVKGIQHERLAKRPTSGAADRLRIEGMEEAARICDDQEEPAYYGYENPYTFRTGAIACENAIRSRIAAELEKGEGE